MTAQSERERDSNRDQDWRRERETEKMRDRARYKDMDPRDRHYERDRAPAPRPREGEREWRDRERRQEDDRSKNGRPLSNVEKETEREVERGMKKGDTFPRMRKSSPGRGRRMTASTEMGEERRERRQRDRPRREETDEWERERERAWQRERYRERERDEVRSRAKEEGKNTLRRPEDEKRHRERYQESDVDFQDRRREVGDSWDRRERDAGRKREKPRFNVENREVRASSPHRRRDRDIYSDGREREKAQRREGWRDTRSEGDSDERELRRERQREELTYQHSRSEGESMGKTERERGRDRQGYREEEGQRYRDRDRDREADRSRRRAVEKDRERYREADRRGAREADREGERWSESARHVRDDRRQDDRYRDYNQRRGRETKEREADPRWADKTGRGGRSPNRSAPRVPPRAQSSGEWSTTESDRDVEEQRNPERTAERRIRSERQERDGGETAGGVSEQRRMWLEPQRGKNRKEEFVDRERHTRGEERRREEERGMESQAEWTREGQRVKEEPDERYSDQSSYRGRHGGRHEHGGDIERESEGVSVDGEEVGEGWREIDKGGKEHLSERDVGIEGRRRSWDAEGENMTDNTEESDREEEGGSDYWGRSESEGGSERGWQQDRDRMLSGEDGFVTVSSGGDEEDEREEDEEDEFEDCQEFWEGGDAYDDLSPAAFKGHEGEEERREEWTMGKEEMGDEDRQGREKSKYVFCVIGQTLPRLRTSEKSPSQVDQVKGEEKGDPCLERRRHCSDDATRQPLDDLHPTLSRHDEYPINNVPREEGAAMGETTVVDIRYGVSSELQSTETGEEIRCKKEHPYAEIGPINRDSQTERLLMEWRDKNKDMVDREREQPLPVPSNPYDDVCSGMDFEQLQPILDGIKAGAMSPEEVEAIRIRMSGAWSMSEEPKRHSQAPHLKWAKNVVREILGRSEEQTLDELNVDVEGDRGFDRSETAMENDRRQEEVAHESGEMPFGTLRTEEQHSEPELEEEELLEVEGLRGMGQIQADMHADQFAAMHGDTPTYTHADTLLDTEGKEDHSMDKETEPSGHFQLEKADIEVKVSEEAGDEGKVSEKEKEARREKEVEMYLSVSNTLYKPNSCPILNCETGSDFLKPSRGGEAEDRAGESEEERQGEEPEERGTAEEVGKMREEARTEVDTRQVVAGGRLEGGTVKSSCSFRDLGPEARLRRRGIRKTTERRNGEHVGVEEEEGVGRDRRTRIFSTTGKEKRWRC